MEIGFQIDYHLFDHVKIRGENYCKTINKALKKDEKAILDLSKQYFYDFASYQHGAVLIEIIDRYSEEKYLTLINELSKMEKENICMFLKAGLDFTLNEKYRNRTFRECFPLLYALQTHPVNNAVKSKTSFVN